jgi:hypothetical protein
VGRDIPPDNLLSFDTNALYFTLKLTGYEGTKYATRPRKKPKIYLRAIETPASRKIWYFDIVFKAAWKGSILRKKTLKQQ